MLVSIITVCLNNRKFIPFAIESVLNQSYPNIEYIVIDGGSTDGTVEILKSYGDQITRFISEPDLGIYDAMNKGISLASGDIVGILNSDDLYFDNNVISEVVEQFKRSSCPIIFGDLYYVNKDNTSTILRKWATKGFVPNSFRKGWHPPHPTFFVFKKIYDDYGLFDLQYKLAADFELMLRFLEKHRIQCLYFPRVLVKMRMGGATNKSLKNIFNQNIECYRAFKNNGLPVSMLYPLYRLVPKLAQFFKI